jgi:hypothetical protein
MYKFIKNVNANVEEGRRYLTDVVKLELAPDGANFKVTLHPAVASGTEVITPVAVHPKLPSQMVPVTVPTYTVPDTLKVLVRAEPENLDYEEAGGNVRNWVETTVTVYPIVSEVFTNFDVATAYYEEVAHQLEQGDKVRNYRRSDVVLRDMYNTGNSRSH